MSLTAFMSALRPQSFGRSERRGLALPDGLAGTGDVLRFIAEKISTKTYAHIMGQYHPCHHADRYPELRRRPNPVEMEDAIRSAHELGLFRLD